MIIKPAKAISGEVTMPGDKSISHRALMLGSLAKGRTVISNLLDCDDCNYTMRAFSDMGIRITCRNGLTTIYGKGLRGLAKPASPLNVGESGTSIRILAGILAGQRFDSILTGYESLSKRPMKRVIEPLSLMGAYIKARKGEHPPLAIKGSALAPIDYMMDVPSAQVKSAILFAALYAEGVTTVVERYRSRNHTELMMKYFGGDIKTEGFKVSLKGGRELKPRIVEVPGDISSAAFFIVLAALLPGPGIRINDIGLNPTRSGVLEVLSAMGADIRIVNRSGKGEPKGDILVRHAPISGVVIKEDMLPRLIDELPVIFVAASLSRGKTVIRGAKELRFKETDRIASMKYNLERMGADIFADGDDVVIRGVRALKGAALKSYGDHRTCMSMSIAALAAKGESSMDDIKCVRKSLPEFFDILEQLKS